MRISDWRSDVCSSDLDHAVEGRVELGAERVDRLVGLLERQRDAAALEVDVDDLDEDLFTDRHDLLGERDVAARQLGDVHEALDAVGDANECAERDELGDLADRKSTRLNSSP